MVDFNTEHKEEMGAYFSEGIHEVVITAVSEGVNDNGKPYIEFAIEGKNGEQGNARLWFSSDKAIRYSFNNIRNIFVHNATKKDAARDMVNKVTTSTELVALCNKALIGKEAFYRVEKSDYRYTNAAGEEKQGYNRDLLGYKPEPKKDEPKADLLDGATSVEEVPDVF